MDLDSFLAAPKWDLLHILSLTPSSPIELAQITRTTVSYVSQQLKLLEAVGIVQKTKTGAYEKGKPRNIFSLTDEFVYLTVLSNGFSEKKKVSLDSHKKALMKIWMLEDTSLHLPCEHFFVLIHNLLKDIGAILLDTSKSQFELILFSDSKTIERDVQALTKKSVPTLTFSVRSIASFEKMVNSETYTLYENNIVLNREQKKLKGGLQK